MMRSNLIKLASAGAFFMLCTLAVDGVKANIVGYQGILTNAAGDSLLNGDYDLTFAIFPSETGGTAIWTESHTDVSVDNGVYTVQLGSVNPLPDVIGAGRWLEIEVDVTTLSPRLPISADFRAIEARHAENADSVNHIPASTTPTAGHLMPLDNEGKFPEEVIPFRADSVLAGFGLTSSVARSRRSLDERVTLNVGEGDGIDVTSDEVSATLGEDIQTVEIDDEAVTTAKLADNSVTSAKIVDNTVATADIAPNAVTSAEIAANAVTTQEIADNAVNSAKVLDNSLTIADIAPGIISSVDGVQNDGGDIDLVAGSNITITPDDAANNITISSGNTPVQGGICIDVDTLTTPPMIDLDLDFLSNSNCIDVDYDETDCEVTFDFDYAAEGDNCIDVDWDADNCVLTVQSLLTLIEGVCIDINEDADDCDYTISVDMTCFENLIDSLIVEIFDTLTIEVDSTFDSEIYARSFVVTDDPLSGTTTGARGHWRSNGTLELYGDGGDTVRIKPNGTIDIIQDGELVAGLDENGEFFARSFMVINAQGDTVGHLTSGGDLEIEGGVHTGDGNNGHDFYPGGTWDAWRNGERVAGLDEDGEIFARSFYVLNAQGDTVAHIRSDGSIVVTDDGNSTNIHPGSVVTDGPSGSTIQGGDGVIVTGSGGGISISPGGTWTATQNDTTVAGLDSNGEIFARSFYVKDPATGDTLIHLTAGGQILVDGEPIEGGAEIDSVFDSEIYARSVVVTPDGTLENSRAHITSEGDIIIGDYTFGLGLGADGTWLAFQNGDIIAGLDSTGEIFARSFYVLNADGDTVVHIDDQGVYIDDESGAVNLDTDGVYIVDSTGSSGHSFGTDGTWSVGMDGIEVAGLDSTGELFARSFFVRNAEGDTLAHITSDGQFLGPDGTPIGGSIGDTLYFIGDTSGTIIGVGGMSTVNSGGMTTIDPAGVAVTGATGSHYLNNNGTWKAYQNGKVVAGLDSTGEIFARSFEVRDSSNGELVAHLTDDGNLYLPPGAEVLIGGVPIGGEGEGEVITRTSGGNESSFGANEIATENSADGTGISLTPDGQWTATQNGIQVAGLDENGELYAASVYVKDPDTGDTLSHLTSSGNLELKGEISGGGEITTSAPDGFGHTNRGLLTPTQMGVNNINAETNSGWMFNADGSGIQYMGGVPGVQFTTDGYSVFPTPLFLGPQENSQYLSSEGPVAGIQTSGNFSANGDITAENVYCTKLYTEITDPIICEVFKTSPAYQYEPGTVIITDPASDYYVPCTAEYQTAVVGVVSPGASVDSLGNILTVILGAQAPPMPNKSTRLEVKVKADASYGSIKRGDLLTTSATLGHAMLASEPKIGTVIGKALESLESGKGEIKVMVTLN